MKKILLIFTFFGMLSVNSSYSMVKSGDSKESSFINLVSNFLGSFLNIFVEDKDSMEVFLKEEGFWKDFCKDFRAGVFSKDPLTWKTDR